jgi:putative ABC transport system permease protein
MELRPILSSMLRNKTGAILVGLQIALTLAVLANAVFIIVQRAERIGRPTGLDQDNLFFAQSYGFGPSFDHRDTVRRDLDLIRALPGVVDAAAINNVPLSNGRMTSSFGRTAQEKSTEGVQAVVYTLDEHGLAALGVKLLEGRAFTESEVQYHPDPNNSQFVPSVIVTRDMARAMFGDTSALGRNVHDGLGQSAVIVGVVDNVLTPWPELGTAGNVIFLPQIGAGPTSRYVVRAEPGRRDGLIMEVEHKLSESNPHRAITWVRPHDYWIERTYRADSRMIAFLTVIVVLMVTVTALGIVGLASFHVNVRRKQIGTRRAIGARRIDIIRYFMVENWLLTTGGVVTGTILAFAFGQWLSSAYALPRLQPMYVAVGCLLLWVLGQLAVFVPARRAAAIPPAIATRTV